MRLCFKYEKISSTVLWSLKKEKQMTWALYLEAPLFASFWRHWVFTALPECSPAVVSGAALRWDARAPHCGGLACCGAWAPRCGGLSCCGARAPLCGGLACCGARAPLCGGLLAVAGSPAVERGLLCGGLACCGARAEGTRALGTAERRLSSCSASAGGFLTTVPPWKSPEVLFKPLYQGRKLSRAQQFHCFKGTKTTAERQNGCSLQERVVGRKKPEKSL